MSSPFDPTAMMDKLRETFSGFGQLGTGKTMPQLDVSGLFSAQKGMMEAVVAANQTLMEGLMALMKRQSEMMQETVQQVAQSAQTVGQLANSPHDLMAQQAETAQQTISQSIANARELADMATKSYRDALDRVHSQISAQLAELKDAALKAKANS
ncbi:MAG: TIGR01841 family phasin [Rhodospirillales bacterium]|nr:TIGR01841 family phasin [Rhodospirillales bacterium]